MVNQINEADTKEILKEKEIVTPEARAERLKRLRNLANLNRKEMCDSNDININTYKGWELGRFGGLTSEGAEKVVKRITKEGVICSIDWLLFGKNPSPYLVPDLTSNTIVNKIEAPALNQIEREFSTYQDTFDQAVLAEVLDDGVLPSYKIGDFVAGIKKYGENISLTIDQICIVETITGERLIRYVKKGKSDDLYTLICTNYLSDNQKIITSNVNLIFSAVISRHYILNNI